MAISPMNLTDYHYNLYNDYLSQLDDNLVQYGNQNSMSIKYWHIIVENSPNHNEISMQNSFKNYVYDIYHFLPTLEMSPLTYQINYAQSHKGTSNVATGQLAIFLIDKPLPGDLFQFYGAGDTTDAGETFRITHVQYMRTSKNKLKLYQLEFETAPLKKASVDNLDINAIWYWDTESNRFIDETQYEAYSVMVDQRPQLVKEINAFYNREEGHYSASSLADFQPRPMIFLNTILKRIKKHFNDLDIKPLFGVGTAEIPINWILKDEYWDTFTCASQQEESQGELFNLTSIIAGNCIDCPQELLDELSTYGELYNKVKELVLMLAPFLTDEEMNDITCGKNCCNELNENYVNECFKAMSLNNFDELATGADGTPTPIITGTVWLTSADLGPLWFSFQNGMGYKKYSNRTDPDAPVYHVGLNEIGGN